MRENLERESERGKGKSGATRVYQNEGGNSSAKKNLTKFHFLDQTTTSFFFSNFGEDVSRVDLSKAFASFGWVGKVFIPKKLSKVGTRFGFVKFKEVHDLVALEARLADVWCGGRCLKVNLSCFRREATVVPEVRKEGKRAVSGNVVVSKEVSYKVVLANEKSSEG